MKNKKLDVFLIEMDKKTMEINMKLLKREVDDLVNINVKKKKQKKQFFVMIEPVKTYCIYNRVDWHE